MKPQDSGFVVLIIVLILGALSSAAAGALLVLSAASVQTSLSSEQSYDVQGLAGACAEVALKQIYQDPNYTGSNVSVTIGSDSCTYTVTGAAPTKTVTTVATMNGVKRRVQVNVTQTAPPMTYSSWSQY